MPGRRIRFDPTQNTEPPIVAARREMDWYRRGAERAKAGDVLTLVILLTLGAATTVTAAYGAPAWLTASLAASGVVVAGLRSAFRYHDLSASRQNAFKDIEREIKLYERPPERIHTPDEEKVFLDVVYQIARAERSQWDGRRKQSEAGNSSEST